MKTYILRDPKAVEPQKVRFVEPPHPQTGTPVEPVVQAPRTPALYVGLEVHTDSIAVSLAPSDSTEVRSYGLIGGTHEDVLRLAKKVQAAHPGVKLKFGYSARERAAWLIAVRQEPFSLGPRPSRTAIRSAAVCAPTAPTAS